MLTGDTCESLGYGKKTRILTRRGKRTSGRASICNKGRTGGGIREPSELEHGNNVIYEDLRSKNPKGNIAGP